MNRERMPSVVKVEVFWLSASDHSDLMASLLQGLCNFRNVSGGAPNVRWEDTSNNEDPHTVHCSLSTDPDFWYHPKFGFPLFDTV